jgi:hypothetical protein
MARIKRRGAARTQRYTGAEILYLLTGMVLARPCLFEKHPDLARAAWFAMRDDVWATFERRKAAGRIQPHIVAPWGARFDNDITGAHHVAESTRAADTDADSSARRAVRRNGRNHRTKQRTTKEI